MPSSLSLLPITIFCCTASPTSAPIKAGAIEPRAQTIFTWHLPLGTPIHKRIEEHYRLVSAIGEGRVYRSFILEPPGIAHLPRILLPVAGTVGKTNGWRVDQSVRNGGRTIVHLLLRPCATRCEFDLTPGNTCRWRRR